MNLGTEDIHLIRIIIGISISLLSVVSYAPYLSDMLRGKTKPHAFSWLIWTILMGIGFFGQYADGGGAGSWLTGVTALLSAVIFVASLRFGERSILRADWICLVTALSAIPLWLATSTPLWSMVLISIIDAVGFIPTFRKAYHKPFEETALTFQMSAIKHSLSLVALENFSITTALYPLSLVAANIAFVSMLMVRRRASHNSKRE